MWIFLPRDNPITYLQRSIWGLFVPQHCESSRLDRFFTTSVLNGHVIARCGRDTEHVKPSNLSNLTNRNYYNIGAHASKRRQGYHMWESVGLQLQLACQAYLVALWVTQTYRWSTPSILGFLEINWWFALRSCVSRQKYSALYPIVSPGCVHRTSNTYCVNFKMRGTLVCSLNVMVSSTFGLHTIWSWNFTRKKILCNQAHGSDTVLSTAQIILSDRLVSLVESILAPEQLAWIDLFSLALVTLTTNVGSDGDHCTTLPSGFFVIEEGKTCSALPLREPCVDASTCACMHTCTLESEETN